MPSQSFTLTLPQQAALIVIEVQQQAMAFACNTLASQQVDQKPAADVLLAALKALDEAKMAWLKNTQFAVQLAGAIPDKMKLVEPH